MSFFLCVPVRDEMKCQVSLAVLVFWGIMKGNSLTRWNLTQR